MRSMGLADARMDPPIVYSSPWTDHQKRPRARSSCDFARPPKQRQTFNSEGIRSLMRRLNLVPPRQKSTPETLATSEWWLPNLARLLDMPTMTLYDWVRRGWLKARQQPDWPKHWIIWADETEIERLKAHRQQPFGEILRQRWRGEVPAIALMPVSLPIRLYNLKARSTTMTDPLFSAKQILHQPSDVYGGIQAGLSRFGTVPRSIDRVVWGQCRCRLRTRQHSSAVPSLP
jgi:hypothetical protein